VLAVVFRRLAQELGLEGEYVIEHAIDPPALEPVVGDHAGALELPPQQSPQGSVDTRPPLGLRLLEHLKTPVERQLPQPVPADLHVPSTSTLPASVTLTFTRSSDGSV
jgi:hypothetical protein